MTRLYEIAPAARGNQDAGSRNLPSVFYVASAFVQPALIIPVNSRNTSRELILATTIYVCCQLLLPNLADWTIRPGNPFAFIIQFSPKYIVIHRKNVALSNNFGRKRQISKETILAKCQYSVCPMPPYNLLVAKTVYGCPESGRDSRNGHSV